MANTPTPAPAPVAFDAKKRTEEIEQFYAKWIGQPGYNPYFYLTDKGFYPNVYNKVKQGEELTEKEVAIVKSVELDERHAKAPKNHINLYREIAKPPVQLGSTAPGAPAPKPEAPVKPSL